MEHWNAAQYLLRYVDGYLDHGFTYTYKPGCPVIEGYADADWGSNPETRQSTTGYAFKSFGGLVSWKSCRQPTVALSTTEAKYMATTETPMLFDRRRMSNPNAAACHAEHQRSGQAMHW
jgi:hypothetical protein